MYTSYDTIKQAHTHNRRDELASVARTLVVALVVKDMHQERKKETEKRAKKQEKRQTKRYKKLKNPKKVRIESLQEPIIHR